jgi:hypothetical protein
MSWTRSRRTAPLAATAGVVAVLLALFSRGFFGGPSIITIAAADFDPENRSRGWMEGTWSERGERRPVFLSYRPALPSLLPWLELGLYAERGGDPLGVLVVSSNAAILNYHLASQEGAVGGGLLLPNRLARIGRGEDAGDFRLAVVIEPLDAGAAPRVASIADLDPEEGARMIALAESLGAWGAIERDRYPRGSDGRPRLPFFVPRGPGDWRQLSGTSLEVLLPPAIGRYLLSRPDMRELTWVHLSRFAAALPALKASVSELARSPTLDLPRAEVSELEAALDASFAAYRGYLSSVWVENLIAVEPAGDASITLYLHSVVPVSLEEFVAELGKERASLEEDGVGSLRLRDPATGETHAAALEGNRLSFPVGRRIRPVAQPTGRFETVRVDFSLSGLGSVKTPPWKILEALRPRIWNLVTGEEVPRDHITGFSSLRDPRYGVREQEGRDASLSALSQRIEGTGLGSGDSPIALDRGARLLTVPEGAYVVSEDLILPDGFGLVLHAGVELRIEPGRSILVRGPLWVRGSAEKPVLVRGSSEGEPWGVLAVQGRGSSSLVEPRERVRSEIRHLILEGGSEDHLRGAHYSGQLSVYHADLKLDHSTLRRAQADDALNVKHGRVSISDCAFVDNRADGVDLDWVEGSVQRSLFSGGRPNGDGLDVSGSGVAVEDSVFGGALDKCLSVGEGAEVRIRGSLLRDCAVGVASKDLSRTEVSESLFLDNQRDFAAYQKKKVFGGGRIRARDLILVRTRASARRDDSSEIEIEHSIVIAGEGAEIGSLDSLEGAEVFSREQFRQLRAEISRSSD